MRQKSASEMASELSLLMHQRLGVRGGGLEAKIARAGRLLPAGIRRQAAEIAAAEAREGNPRLARLNDPRQLMRAFVAVERHLKGIDATDRRIGRILGLAGSISFSLIAVAAALLGLLAWRGDL